jgi:aspartate aminotransferase
VLVVPGGKVTMFFAIMMFGEPGTEIIYPNPGFPIYESGDQVFRREAGAGAALREKGFAFSADEVLAQRSRRKPA